jgi:hypothetical protein
VGIFWQNPEKRDILPNIRKYRIKAAKSPVKTENVATINYDMLSDTKQAVWVGLLTNK